MQTTNIKQMLNPSKSTYLTIFYSILVSPIIVRLLSLCLQQHSSNSLNKKIFVHVTFTNCKWWWRELEFECNKHDPVTKKQQTYSYFCLFLLIWILKINRSLKYHVKINKKCSFVKWTWHATCWKWVKDSLFLFI